MSLWLQSHRFDRRAAALADRHYSRQKPGTPQFVAPGRCIVLLTAAADALWVSLWQAYSQHAWPGAWNCALFRNESAQLSSDLVRDAIAVTRHLWGEPPPAGMITFIDAARVRPKRDPGRCFRKAGFSPVGLTAGGKLVLGLAPGQMPPAHAPLSPPIPPPSEDCYAPTPSPVAVR